MREPYFVWHIIYTVLLLHLIDSIKVGVSVIRPTEFHLISTSRVFALFFARSSFTSRVYKQREQLHICSPEHMSIDQLQKRHSKIPTLQSIPLATPSSISQICNVLELYRLRTQVLHYNPTLYAEAHIYLVPQNLQLIIFNWQL